MRTSIEYYKELAAKCKKMGADSISVRKTWPGILTPAAYWARSGALKEAITVPIVVHTLRTGGIAQLTYQAVIEAGADRYRHSPSPLSEDVPTTWWNLLAIALRKLGYDISDGKIRTSIADHSRN